MTPLHAGSDCQCGHPMIERPDGPVCAVYGRAHTPTAKLAPTRNRHGNVLWLRDHSAPAAALIDMCVEAS